VSCEAHALRAGAGPKKRKSHAVAGCVSIFFPDGRGVAGDAATDAGK